MTTPRFPWFGADTFSRFTAISARPVALTGLFCFVPRSGDEASFVRTDQWLGTDPRAGSSAGARRAGPAVPALPRVR